VTVGSLVTNVILPTLFVIAFSETSRINLQPLRKIEPFPNFRRTVSGTGSDCMEEDIIDLIMFKM